MNDEKIVTVLHAGNWIVLVLLFVAGWLLFSLHFAAGLAAGGLLAIANFFWLHSIMIRTVRLPKGKAQAYALSRYLLRLAIIGVIIYFLITRFGFNVIGLLVGLSVPVMSIFALTIYRLISRGG
jgi:small-conductance mechanosensitive channel